MKGSHDGGRLLALVDALAGRRVVIAGDLIADEFIYGRIARVSREAPVLILNYDSTEIVPGGAGNAAGNVVSLGGDARLVGVAGRDETGRRLLGTLKSRRVGVGAVLRPAGYRTPTKTRILAGGIHSAKQQVVRIDRAASSGISTARLGNSPPRTGGWRSGWTRSGRTRSRRRRTGWRRSGLRRRNRRLRGRGWRG